MDLTLPTLGRNEAEVVAQFCRVIAYSSWSKKILWHGCDRPGIFATGRQG